MVAPIARLRRHLMPYLIRRSRKHFPRLKIGVVQVTSHEVLKIRNLDSARCEVEAIRFVLEHTTIPVPKLLDYWEEDGKGRILMQFIEGQTLARAWNVLSQGQRLHVMRTIAGYVDELRSLSQPAPPPESGLPQQGWIGSTSGNGFLDYKIGSPLLGPFPDERAFRDWHTSLFKMFGDIHPPTGERIENIRRAIPVDHRIVFTHGDINRRNILVRVHGEEDEDVEVVALLDWEQAGWRPIYWEGMKWDYMADGKGGWREYPKEVIYRGYETVVNLHDELLGIAGFPPYDCQTE